MPKRTNDGLKKRCTCGRRKWAKCAHPWHFGFFYGGIEHRYSLDAIARERNLKPPRTKSDAEALRDSLRGEIRAGTFPAAPTAVDATAALTFEDIVKFYRERYVNVPMRRPSAKAMFDVHLNMLLRAKVPAAHGQTIALKDKPIDAITKADVESIRMQRRAELAAAARLRDAAAAPKPAETASTNTDANKVSTEDAAARKVRRPGSKLGEVGINRLLARLRHVFSWAMSEGYVSNTPFKRNGQTVIALEHLAETARPRRLEAGEEERLLAHASPDLRALIIAALSTGCRRGELLSLQWTQVRCDEHGKAQVLVLPAGRTKTNEPRAIPVGSGLRAVLEMRRLGPDGQPLPVTAHVFGNAVGEEITSIRAAWEELCAAAGIRDLHFHDLRREFACRLLESAADLHEVKDFLGHANITTTSTYLKSTPVRLAKALERMEAANGAPPAEENLQDSHATRTNEGQNANGRFGDWP